ncbi:MAG: magnesium transporter [Gemmatimonadetes bacterium]|nr:magnesium transporter [Gemmatimonadota bacterium]
MTGDDACRLLALVRNGQIADFLAEAEELGAADLADVLAEADEDERVEIVKLLPPSLSGSALWELPEEEHAEDTLAALEPGEAAEILEGLPDDDAADLLEDLEPEEQRRILAEVEDPEQREEVADLLQYDRETAGGLMTSQVVTVMEHESVGQGLDEIRRQADELEDFSEAYVVDGEGRLKGIMSFKRLVLSAPDRPLREVMEDPDVTVPPEMDQEEVARLMGRYNVSAIPVVNRDQRLLGRITFDDVMDVGEAEATEDLLRFGGVSGDEDLGAGWREAVRSRLPWLLVNLATAFFAAMVPLFFSGTIERLGFLAAFMGVVAGMGGNTGTQALAVNVRRLALGLIDFREFWEVIRKEMVVGGINGVATGFVAGLVATVIKGNPMFGVVVFFAMTGNMLVAGFAGAFIPMILKRFGIDPALASSVFVTTFTDTCGFFFLLGLSTWLLL